MSTPDDPSEGLEVPEGQAGPRPRMAYRGTFVAILVALLLMLTFGVLLLFDAETPICGCKSDTLSMAPAFVGNGTCGGVVRTYNVSLYPSVMATTSDFVAVLSTPMGSLVPFSTQAHSMAFGAGCAPSSTSGWYGVLWSTDRTPEATLTNSSAGPAWTAIAHFTLPASIATNETFEVVVGAGVATPASDTLSFSGINGNSVTGITAL